MREILKDFTKSVENIASQTAKNLQESTERVVHQSGQETQLELKKTEGVIVQEVKQVKEQLEQMGVENIAKKLQESTERVVHQSAQETQLELKKKQDVIIQEVKQVHEQLEQMGVTKSE